MERFKLDTKDWLLIGCLSAISMGFFLLANDIIDLDDAYISYRYAFNLAQGNGAVCNVGERVYGSTSLGWVGWLAFWSRLSGASVASVSWVSSLVFMALNCAILYLWVRHLTSSRWLSTAASLLLLSAPWFIMIGAMGLETMFYVLLILLSFTFYSFQYYLLAGLLSGAVFCTRPDGLAVFAALAGASAIDRFFASSGKLPWERMVNALKGDTTRLIVGFLVIALPFVFMCYAYYGCLLPQTLQAKRLHQMIASRWWMPNHFIYGTGWPVLVGLLLGAVALATKALRWNPSSRVTNPKPLFAMILWLGLYVCAWTIVRIDMYPWYIAALGPASALAVILPLTIAYHSRLPASLRIGLVLWLIVAGTYWSCFAYRDIKRFLSYLRKYEVPRFETAKAINAYTEPGKERIGAGAMGIIGYYCPSQAIHDFSMLTATRNMLDDPACQPTLLISMSQETGKLKSREIQTINAGGRRFEYELVHVCASKLAPVYIEVWARQDGASTWDPTRRLPTKSINASFGSSLQLLGANPIRSIVHADESIRCEVLWQFQQALGKDARIVYFVSKQGSPPIARFETTGLFRNARPYQQVKAGETILDFVEIPLSGQAPAGHYTLSAAVLLEEALQPDEAHRLPDHPDQVCIIEVEVLDKN